MLTTHLIILALAPLISAMPQRDLMAEESSSYSEFGPGYEADLRFDKFYPEPNYGYYGSGTGVTSHGTIYAIVIPLVIVGGILLGLSSLSYTLENNNPANGRSNSNHLDFINRLNEEVQNSLDSYIRLLQSDACTERTACELGRYLSKFKQLKNVIKYMDTFAPEDLKASVNIFQAAATDTKFPKCNLYKCKMKPT